MQNKTCSECEENKPVELFYRATKNKDGFSLRCKICHDEKFRPSKEQTFEYRLSHRYGLSLEKYQELLSLQGNRCATCARAPERFYVDHDHACCAGTKSCGGCVRGLLCFNCNTALGQVRDDPRVLLAMVDYLVGAGE